MEKFDRNTEKGEKHAVDVWAWQQKKEGCPEGDAREKEEAELAMAGVEGEEQERRGQEQAEKGVAEVGQAGAQDPQGTKHRPDQGQGRPEAHGPQKLFNLIGDGQAHPSSRARKPPSFRFSS